MKDKRKYRFGHKNNLSLGGLRIECNVTQRCNARCEHCNKAVGYADGLLKEMTAEQVARAVDQLIEQNVKITRFTFCGGEPVLNKELQQMIYEVDRLPTLHVGRVLTNGLNASKPLRDKIKMPKRFKWVVNPLDDPDDPLSGKNDPKARPNKRVHTPFWISPADIGEEAKFENCTVRGWCGMGLDVEGWSMCGKAVMFGKLLGIDPTMKEGDIEQHISTPINEICKHCQYGLAGKRKSKKIAQRYAKGELPAITKTFREAFERHAQNDAPLVQLEVF